MWREDELREEAGIGVKKKHKNKRVDPCYFDIRVLNKSYFKH